LGDLARAGRLPDATLAVFDVSGADPELGAGRLLHPGLPFAPWKDEALGSAAARLFEEADEEARLAGWRGLTRAAVRQGAVLPLFQAVQTLVRDRRLSYRPYANGGVLAQTMEWL